MQRGMLAAVLALTVAACGATSLTVSEYAVEVEAMVDRMEGQFAAIDAEWESQPPSLAGALEYWDSRLTIRHEYLEDLDALEPPDGIASMHTTALEVFGKITAADEALAARVSSYQAVTEHWQWLDTPEGAASLAVLEEVYTFCRSSQAEFDATEDRASLAETPWVPQEMKEIVKVAFGCPPPDTAD